MGATVPSGGGSARITQRLLVTVILAVTVTGALTGCGADVAGAPSTVASTSVPTSAASLGVSPLPSPSPSASAGSLDGFDAALATVDGSVQQSQDDLANGDQSAIKNDNG